LPSASKANFRPCPEDDADFGFMQKIVSSWRKKWTNNNSNDDDEMKKAAYSALEKINWLNTIGRFFYRKRNQKIVTVYEVQQ
jgi:hypothetical protein